MNLNKVFLVMTQLIKKYTSFMVGGKSNLDKVIKQNKKLIIIFGHPLCSPCQKIMFKIPLIFLYYKIKGYNLKFCNVKENCISCEKKFINTTPTMIIYKNGQEIKRYESEEVLKNLYNI